MAPQRVDVWVWVLIYGGLIAVALGLAVQSRQAALGWTIAAIGGGVAAVGGALIWVRSRMKSSDPR